MIRAATPNTIEINCVRSMMRVLFPRVIEIARSVSRMASYALKRNLSPLNIPIILASSSLGKAIDLLRKR